MAKPFYRATLTGRKPFSSFTIPGTNPTVVVGRAGALLDAETAEKLKKALKAGAIPNLKADDVSIDEVDGPRGGASAETSDVAALQARVAELEAAAGANPATDLLDALTVEQLTDLAGKRKVTIDSKATKGDIISALLAPDEPSR